MKRIGMIFVLFFSVVFAACSGKLKDESEAKNKVTEKTMAAVSPTAAPTPTSSPTPAPTLTPSPIKHPYVGKIIFFGEYEQDSNKANGKEDIEWIVLDVVEERALLLSQKCLEVREYEIGDTSDVWENSGIRRWLNNDFQLEAFENRSCIVGTYLRNEDYEFYDSQDEIFLLSAFDIDRYFNENEAKIAEATQYVQAKSMEECYWLTRTSGNEENLLTFIDNVGDTYGGAVDNYPYGIRPAMWVDITNNEFDVKGDFAFDLGNECLWEATPAEYFEYEFDFYGGLSITGIKNSVSVSEIIIPEKIAGHTTLYIDMIENKNIESIYIPKSVRGFNGELIICENLKEFKVDSDNERYFTRDGILYSYSGGVEVVPAKCEISDYKVPHDVYRISSGAFRNCQYIERIFVPEHVKFIETGAFSGCVSLQQVSIQGAETQLGDKLFLNCINLAKVELPSETKEIPMSMFYGCKSLVDLVLPKELEKIGFDAFYDCTSLEEVDIPKSVVDIESSAFEGCVNLRKVTGIKNVKIIESSVFNGCESLESIILPEGIKTIESYAFCSCNSLKNVTLPSTVVEIGDSAFLSCGAIESIIIPEGVTRINYGSFDFCENLKTISFPASLAEFSLYGFRGCDNLEIINYSGTMQQWKQIKNKKVLHEIPVICIDGVIQ